MTIDEGYIKYHADWIVTPPIDAEVAELLDRWRQPLYDAGLIGHYDELNVGFGNLSIRDEKSGHFFISGTQTGELARTDGRHYSLVCDYDIDGNSVTCRGPVQASSESLTHATLYQLDDSIGAVVHVHSIRLWMKLRDRLPTTDKTVSYGTPEMAREFERLYRETTFSEIGIAVMAGHEEGLVSIGQTLEEAALRMLDLDREFA